MQDNIPVQKKNYKVNSKDNKVVKKRQNVAYVVSLGRSRALFTVGSSFTLDTVLDDPRVVLYLIKRDSLLRVKNQEL